MGDLFSERSSGWKQAPPPDPCLACQGREQCQGSRFNFTVICDIPDSLELSPFQSWVFAGTSEGCSNSMEFRG